MDWQLAGLLNCFSGLEPCTMGQLLRFYIYKGQNLDVAIMLERGRAGNVVASTIC